jgi:hypothetical protein
MMMVVNQRKMSIYVDKFSQQWIVRDADGAFWIVPAEEEGWKHREAFTPTDETELEPVPGHYHYLLGLPR